MSGYAEAARLSNPQQRKGFTVIELLVCITIVVIHSSFSALASDTDVDKLRLERLERYSFDRATYNPKEMALLMGNSEMGGCARLDGLGFDRIWFADFWRDSAVRNPVYGPAFKLDGAGDFTAYSQRLSLVNGILQTRVNRNNCSYRSEIFFSSANRHLLVIRLSHLDGKARTHLRLQLPTLDMDIQKTTFHKNIGPTTEPLFVTEQLNPHTILGTSIDAKMLDQKSTRRLAYRKAHVSPHRQNQMTWGVYCTARLDNVSADGVCTVDTSGKDEVYLMFSNSTNWDGETLRATVIQTLKSSREYETLRKANNRAWMKNWKQGAVLVIPDSRYEQLWYRCNYWLHVTSGSKKFLPGEAQFSAACWSMMPFTYGSGWSTHALLATGYPEKARNMLDWHYKPEAMRYNAHHWLKAAQAYRRKRNVSQNAPCNHEVQPQAAKAFAHEIQAFGKDRLLRICNQPHLQQFGATMFHRAQRLYPSPERITSHTYPVAKGVAEFWANFLIWDSERNHYVTPWVFSMAEGGARNNPLDAVVSAKWCLRTAISYAEQLGVDQDLVRKWEALNQNTPIPQNHEVYLDHANDDGKVRKKTGYAGTKRVILCAGFTSQDMTEAFDLGKVLETLNRSSASNGYGTGMAIFQAEMLALCEAVYGRGDESMKYLEQAFNCLDPHSKTAMCETARGKYPYFLTNSSVYILCPVYLLMQSNSNRITAFPAVPSAWKDVEFYNLPAEHGLRVSGAMAQGKVEWVSYQKDGKGLLRRKDNKPVKIDVRRNTVRVME